MPQPPIRLTIVCARPQPTRPSLLHHFAAPHHSRPTSRIPRGKATSAPSTSPSFRTKWRPAFFCVPFLGTRRHAVEESLRSVSFPPAYRATPTRRKGVVLSISSSTWVTPMNDTVENLILDLLEWVGRQQGTYQETMDARRTSCPRLPVWEDANDRDLVETTPANSHSVVRLTPAGFALLNEKRPAFLRGDSGHHPAHQMSSRRRPSDRGICFVVFDRAAHQDGQPGGCRKT